MRSLFLLALASCGGLSFETPASWESQLAEYSAEYGLPGTLPEPGARPAEFECTVETSVGMMTLTDEEPAPSTGVLLIGAGGTVDWRVLPMPADGVLSFDLVDGTDVYLIGDLLVFDGAFSRMGADCDRFTK